MFRKESIGFQSFIVKPFLSPAILQKIEGTIAVEYTKRISVVESLENNSNPELFSNLVISDGV